ncbi:NADH-quinone oxidoreductase subunit NuoG [Sulfurivirga sp.]|uniref:NADH-quinone oxidoreductase subunit NuoG n=1 Tax=Sulfurivirga sp. TaxID=2614236 RepID=UPI0025EB2D05|nr:NADH-quinone oxidoreductase subunit NuoG [Sulfurivirga sp.]
MIKIEINGQVVEAHEGDMLIDVADSADIPIPRFCYHKKLSIAANCRMCLVEVEGAPKALPACATPVTDGMKVFTRSPKARAAQKAVMEFLLINHPLDCPICDQGGECELQDVAFEYGDDVGKYSEAKRVVPDHDVGPLIATDMTRCIHCTRCVRFGQEISGLMELGAVGRSEWMEITTFVGKSITSEISGNIIDLCPVGALTSKPFRYKARAWELKAAPAIAAHDSLGSNIEVHTYHGKVMRVVPRENEAINEVWLSDRDRFAYTGLYAEDRLTVPMVKRNGRWEEVEWEEALEAVVERLKPFLNSPQDIAVLASPNATVEELYLLRKLTDALGVRRREWRLRQQDFRVEVPLGLKLGLDEVEQLNHVLVVGSHLRHELPLLNLRVRKAQLAGASVHMLNPMDYASTFDIADRLIVKPSEMVRQLAAVAKAAGAELPAGLSDVPVTDQHHAWAEALKQDKSAIFVGGVARMSRHYAELAALAAVLGEKTGASVNILPLAANEMGAQALDFAGESFNDMLEKGAKAVITLGVEPEYDTLWGERAVQMLEQAELVINLTPFANARAREYSDILLPVATAYETAGTLVSATGTWQSFKQVTDAPGDAKPAWKVLRVLGNVLDVDGFDYIHADQVLEEARQAVTEVGAEIAMPDTFVAGGELEVVPSLALYSTDMVVRRAEPLQQAAGAAVAETVSRLETEKVVLCCGETCVELPNRQDEAVAEGAVFEPVAIDETLTVPAVCAEVRA